ncbi:mitophagy protein ATG32 KNAG_0L02100 [Huiozyma naganishii CBS 8797]|uniref:Autophagy-related protein 32 n=1 Tax=Huiozyma naganishii (strain ATCC MYA-139 / BCRC 22969 / CBS 8797 / KCTC 17520 / NBRC 10181 / NCYC 3082 / Yp74L-3) TaxID=1071383 RepID=J7RSD1_HUIN7|nr:hypothetical protein KNAG_0L02100 [Kazachstania naganishii CBS 8797]CCK72828.1 hypothetical protein KNAG_0L02100 [Kazachstania naganishii CBS 8797]
MSGHANSVLDPHLSVLELLEKSCERGGHAEAPGSSRNKGAGQIQLSESWCTVERDELSAMERSASQQTNNGVLSSSDTSEEGEPEQGSPGDGEGGGVADTRMARPAMSLQSTSSTLDGVDDDSATVSKSLTSSSNSFIMPKLYTTVAGAPSTVSTALQTRCFKVAVLGRGAVKFCQETVPEQFRHRFELTAGVHDLAQCADRQGILIVVQEVRELISLLNRVHCACPEVPVVAVYDRDRQVQVKNVLRNFTRQRLVSLLHPPVPLSNNEALDKMFHFVDNLARQQEPAGVIHNDPQTTQEQHPDHNEDDPHRGPSKPEGTFKRWLLWGVSISLGIGAGYYCVSYVVSSSMCVSCFNFRHTDHTLAATTSTAAAAAAAATPSGIDHDADSHTTLRHCLSIVKNSLKRATAFVKQAMHKPFHYIDRSQEWHLHDPNRFLQLGYAVI